VINYNILDYICQDYPVNTAFSEFDIQFPSCYTFPSMDVSALMWAAFQSTPAMHTTFILHPLAKLFGRKMSDQTIKILVTATLFLHGVAHGRAFVALLYQFMGRLPASWLPVRSWLFSSRSSKAAVGVASIFWGLATLGFLAAALSFWGLLLSPDLWSQIVVPSAILSTLGIILISGMWPGAPNKNLSTLDTIIALVVNAAVLITRLWLHWPPS
jgi:hypothetical protein